MLTLTQSLYKCKVNCRDLRANETTIYSCREFTVELGGQICKLGGVEKMKGFS